MGNEHWKTIFGWFDFQAVYDIAVDRLKDGDIAIEIGTWLGKSTCYFAQKLKESGKKVTFYACDKFIKPEYEGEFNEPSLISNDFYNTFIENLKKQEVIDIVTPIIADSLNFASKFKDNSINFLFLDDLHEHFHVIRELETWYPKMKKDSLLAGHDISSIKEAVNSFVAKKGLEYITKGDSYFIEVK